MNFFTIFCASLVCVSLGEPGSLNNLIPSGIKEVGKKLIGKNPKTINNPTAVQNKTEDQEKNEIEELDENEIDENEDETEDQDQNETEDQDQNEIEDLDRNKTNKKKSSNLISKFGKTLSGVTKKIKNSIKSRKKKVTKATEDQDENEVEDKEKNETEDQDQNKREDQDQNKTEDQDEKKTKNKKTSIFSKVGGTLGNFTNKIIDSAKKVTAKVTKKILEKVTNKGVNFLLRQYKRMVQTKDPEGNLTLPDIESKGFAYKVSATGGSFISLSSLEKNGKINFTRDSGKVFIDIPVKLTRMHVGYKKVSASAVAFVKTSGNFSIDVKNNSISIKLRLTTSDKKNCAIRVEEVKITELGDFKLELQGFNKVVSKVTNKVSTFLNNHMKKLLTVQIQKAINKKLKETVDSNTEICSKLMPVKSTKDNL